MNPHINAIEVPIHSSIGKQLQRADFYDSYEMKIEHRGRSALDIYLQMIAKTPVWVNFLMSVRNRIVLIFGLKNLGKLTEIHQSLGESGYQVAERVGIFTLLSATDDEVILGDSDKHLDVKVSICKLDNGNQNSIAVTTVVHIHNLPGRVYMFFVIPMHRLIVPAILERSYLANTHV